MKGDTRCIDGNLYRHDPQPDDPSLETSMGKCPECAGKGCPIFDCEECDNPVFADDVGYDGENCICSECKDKYDAGQHAYWYPLWLGEKKAGLV